MIIEVYQITSPTGEGVFALRQMNGDIAIDFETVAGLSNAADRVADIVHKWERSGRIVDVSFPAVNYLRCKQGWRPVRHIALTAIEQDMFCMLFYGAYEAMKG